MVAYACRFLDIVVLQIFLEERLNQVFYVISLGLIPRSLLRKRLNWQFNTLASLREMACCGVVYSNVFKVRYSPDIVHCEADIRHTP